MANADAVLSQFTQAIEEEKVDCSKKLKIGIIGTGWIAEAHIESYKNMPWNRLGKGQYCNKYRIPSRTQ
jgi:hypothetical protein